MPFAPRRGAENTFTCRSPAGGSAPRNRQSAAARSTSTRHHEPPHETRNPMTMDTFYLVCFGVGLVLSVISVLGGFAHLHLGHLHFGHSALAHHGAAAHSTGSRGLSAVNGFTFTAFLCWFGGAGYLLHRYSIFVAPLVLLLSVVSGFFGAALLWAALFKVLIPRERVLSSEDTEMTAVLAKLSD